MKYITDPAERGKFAEEAKLLSEGHLVEVDSQLVAAALGALCNAGTQPAALPP